MTWNALNTEEILDEVKVVSATRPVILFKHSTRCSISSMAKNRVEKIPNDTPALFYYLDLLNYRGLSNKIAEVYSLPHESPQVLLIVNGECVYEESHNGINAQDIESEINDWQNKLSAKAV